MNFFPSAVLAALFFTATLGAEEVRVFPVGKLPADSRLEPLKDLDGYFPFTPPVSAEAWKSRAEEVRRRMLVALGLWPLPEKTPLNALAYGRMDRGDYTVEKVFFESMPGFFVTGNLYRPKEVPGAEAVRHPGVLCPYGHWTNGRFMDEDAETVKKTIGTGAEKYEDAAHSPIQARCVQLARMGCVVFHYDMLGRGDCQQIPEEVAHYFKKQRPEMSSLENWGLFSPQAEAHLQSVMGLQTWNSMRALDFLSELPDIDMARIGVTGASGGGTQTMILAALDSRVSAAFPAVMVSTAMQGGCTCENASLLRIGTGNVEFAALFAPKPMAMTCANDWTKEMETKGFPELKQHWEKLGAPQNVQLTALTQFPHNYNAPSRAAMYAWFNQHLHLGLPPERLEERDFKRLTREEMSVWDASHPAPAGGEDFERKLLRQWRDDAQAKLHKTPEDFRKLALPAWEVVLGRTLATAGDVTFEVGSKRDRGTYWEIAGPVRNGTYREELPALFLHPKAWNGATVLWLSELGKAGLLEANGGGMPIAGVRKLLEAGVSVIGVDLLYQGEFLAGGMPLRAAPKVESPREFAGYTYGYNDAVFAKRVHDVLSVRKLVQTDGHQARFFGIVALDGTAPLAAAARLMAAGTMDAAVMAPRAFTFLGVQDWRDLDFLPGGAKYGDVAGLLALGGPQPRFNWGEVPANTAVTQPKLDVLVGEKTPAALEWIIQAAAK